jgi:hypothetical protein
MLAPFAPTAPVVYQAERATAATVVERPRGPVGKASSSARLGRRRGWAIAATIGVGALAMWWWSPWSGGGASEASPGKAAATPVAPDRSATISSRADASADPRTYAVAVRTVPATATITFDGDEVGAGAFARELVQDGVTHRLAVRAPGFAPASIVFRDAPPPEVIELVPLEVPSVPKTPRTPTSARPPPDTRTPPGVHSTQPDARPTDVRPDPPERDPDRRLPPTDNRNPWGR